MTFMQKKDGMNHLKNNKDFNNKKIYDSTNYGVRTGSENLYEDVKFYLKIMLRLNAIITCRNDQ